MASAHQIERLFRRSWIFANVCATDIKTYQPAIARHLCRPNVLSLSRHVPSLSGGAARSVAPHEARKRRASERHVVGCCEELGRLYAIARGGIRVRFTVAMAQSAPDHCQRDATIC